MRILPSHHTLVRFSSASVRTFIFAGHDTTAAAVGWLLYELSAHPSDQVNIREEILRTSALSLGDYNSMPLLNAAIKVLFYSPLLPRLQYSSPACQKSLRRNSFVHTLRRVAAQDDVIPLSHPITTREGKVISEIRVRKGQCVDVPVYLYHRSVTVHR